MTDNPTPKYLFIGGTADGQRIVVDDPHAEHRIRSSTGPTLHSHAKGHGDPRREPTPVTETYLPCEVPHGDDTETVFALNALSDHAISLHLARYFGTGTTFRRVITAKA